FPRQFSDEQLNAPPFRFTEDIADWADPRGDFGPGVLVPKAQPLVDEAKDDNRATVTFKVPTIPTNTKWAPSLLLSPDGGMRHAREYVHVRRAPAEAPPDLNDLPDVAARVLQGGYHAVHFKDFTGDGWVDADCPQLRPDFPRFVPAYSLVAAPD